MKSKVGDVVLDAPGTGRASKLGGVRRASGAPTLRRDPAEDFRHLRGASGAEREARDLDNEREHEHYVPRRFAGLRFRLKGGVPRSSAGKVFASAALVAGMLIITAVLWETRSALLHNPRFVIQSSNAIQITGNHHLSRPQLLSVFGEDVDRNILTIPITQRREQLEQLPWVEHATVMRLLPDHFRVAITERTPVAFVRQGSTIGLVDASGTLLDMAADGERTEETHYSFPVVSGVSRSEPLSTRATRMKLFHRFQSELDAGGQEISKSLSEVDLTNPEDVKALIPAGKSDVLVHFGDTDFLHRYELFEKNLAGWQATYPRLASADMRYERQVVLEMAHGAEVPVPAAEQAAIEKAAALTARMPGKVSPVGRPMVKGAATKPLPRPGPVKTATLATPRPAAPGAPSGGHLQTSFDVHAKARPHTSQGEPQ